MVITGLTRNQFVRKHTRVRIPPSAPRNDFNFDKELKSFLYYCHEAICTLLKKDIVFFEKYVTSLLYHVVCAFFEFQGGIELWDYLIF